MPRCGPNTQITLINSVNSIADIFATLPLEGAMLAYPSNLIVHHCVSGEGAAGLPPTEREGIAGYIHNQKLNMELMEEIVGEDAFRGEDTGGGKRAFVCGSDGFNSFVVDALIEMGADNDVIKVLPSDRYLEVI
jgi:ferredoxin-NADP reductase